MLEFIGEHWKAYLVGVLLAVALGFGASYLFLVYGSTPEDAHVEATAEQSTSE